MIKDVAMGLLIPFLGTTLGSACVFFMKKELNRRFRELSRDLPPE